MLTDLKITPKPSSLPVHLSESIKAGDRGSTDLSPAIFVQVDAKVA